jgi:hypothetical protein
MRSSFWIVYSKIQKLFLEKVRKEGGKYPWKLSSIEYGVLEREFLSFLLENEALHFNIGGIRPISALSDISPQSLRLGVNGIRTIKEIHETFDSFYRTRANIAHAFIVGSDNHWFSLFVNKRIVGEEEHLECVYLDARNNKILNQSNEEIMTVVLRRYNLQRSPFTPQDFK